MASADRPFERVWKLVRAIPRGRVATYGQLSTMIAHRLTPIGIGWAIRALPLKSPVPWHRVVNAKGEVSPRRDGSEHDRLQRLMLEKERVRFDRSGRIPLAQYRWRP